MTHVLTDDPGRSVGVAPATAGATSAEERSVHLKLERQHRRKEIRTAVIFLAPFLVLLLIFQYLPLAVMARDSLHSFTLYNPGMAEFVGLDNFVRAFTNPTALGSMLVTLLFMLGFLVVTVPLGFLLAVYLNTHVPARGIIRTLVFLPVVTSTVVVATMWGFILNQSGLANSALGSIGLGPFNFLTDTGLALPAVILMSAWQQIGLAAVMFLGGLQSIPDEVHEAASVDGIGPIRRLFSITLPLVSRTTVLVTVVMTVFAIQAFAPAYVITSGGPEGSTNLFVFEIYRSAFFLQQPGYASALSVILLGFALLISAIEMRLLRTTWSY
ncbi:carbohydrate ABC transporter permease [Agrococcus sp. HG114]|uniref:carbohydrate ABC transporter permease n=1 Tax=Agrococcus sp. HG114 TaxID=2969757 RepID=UPI00215A2F73|nr:sugar ABC transporter permease [Agrococcus sp. HG114]MCR8669563.1 sugar ABC transporter permease [Agrococcus sp. HG114]